MADVDGTDENIKREILVAVRTYKNCDWWTIHREVEFALDLPSIEHGRLNELIAGLIAEGRITKIEWPDTHDSIGATFYRPAATCVCVFELEPRP